VLANYGWFDYIFIIAFNRNRLTRIGAMKKWFIIQTPFERNSLSRFVTHRNFADSGGAKSSVLLQLGQRLLTSELRRLHFNAVAVRVCYDLNRQQTCVKNCGGVLSKSDARASCT
jgi:hypothetical protein